MSRRTNTRTTKPLLMLTVAVAAVLVVISSLCIVFASEDTSAAGMHQVHFEPNGGSVFKGDVESPYYVAVSDEAQMVYVPGSTFTVRVPDPSKPFNDELDFKLMKGELVVDESDELDSYFEVSYAGSGETYVFTVVVKAALFTEKTGWDKILIHPQKGGIPTTAWGAVRLIPVANVTTGASAEFEGNGYTTSLEIANSGNSTVNLTINNNMNYDEEEYRYVKPGYTLVGWSPDQTVTSSSEIYPENMVMNVTGDINLYAVWAPNIYTIRLVVGDTASDYQIAFDQNLDTTHMKNMVPSDMTDYAIVGWSPVELGTVTENHKEGTRTINSTAYNIVDKSSLYPLNIKYKTVPENGILTLYPVYAFKIQINATTTVQLTSDVGCYYFTGTGTSGSITVTGGSPYMFVDNLTMSSSNASPFVIEDGATVNLTVLGDSSFTGGKSEYSQKQNGNTYYYYRRGYAGINVQSNTTLNVLDLSTGTLNAQGGYVISGNSNRITAKSGPGIGSNWTRTLTDEGCGTINVYGGNVVAIGGTAYAYIERDWWGNQNFNGGSRLQASQGIGGSGAALNFKAGNITATTGKVRGYNDNGDPPTDDLIIHNNGGVAAEPLYYSLPNDNVEVDSTNATVIVVGRSGGSTVGGDPVTVQFNTDGSVIGGAQTVTFTFDGVDHNVNLGGAMIQNGTTFKIAPDLIKAGASVKLNTQKGNYFTDDSVSYRNGIYIVDLEQNTGQNHGDVKITVNGNTLNSNTNYFGEINIYESFNIEGTQNTTTVTLILDLLDTYVLNNATITLSKGSGASISYISDNNSYTITAIAAMGSGSGGGITNTINLEIDRKLDTVTFNVHYTGTYASQISSIVTADVVSPAPISSWTNITGGKTASQNVYHNDSRLYLFDITFGGNSLYLSEVHKNNVRDDIPTYDSTQGAYLYTISNITSNVVIDLYFEDSIKVTLEQPEHTVTAFTNLNKASLTGDSVPSSGTIYIKYKTSVDFTVDIAHVDQGNWGISFIMKNGSTTNSIPFKIGQVYNTGELTSDLTLTPYATNLIPYVYLASNPLNDSHISHLWVANTGDEYSYVEGLNQKDYGSLLWYRFKVPMGSHVAFPTLDEFIALCESEDRMDLIKPGYVLTGWKYGETTYVPGGSPDFVTVSMNTVLIAVWSKDVIEYSVSYELGIDISLDNPESFTVNSDTFTLINPSRANNPGYEFVGWTGTGLSEPTITVTIAKGSTGNREYIAHWEEADELTITLKDDWNLVTIDNPTRAGVYGNRYADLNLPIYGNTVKDNVTYIFAGWMIEGGAPIQSGTTILKDEDHAIIIIWQLKNYYPIYINESPQGHVESNKSRCEFDENGVAKYPAVISITPVSGYKILTITIRDTGHETTVFSPTLLPATYDDTDGYSMYAETTVFKKKADTNNTWTYTYTPHGITVVTVTFEAISYTVTVHTGVNQSGESTYEYGVGHAVIIQAPHDTATHEFTGWATTSTGDLVYITEIRPGTDFRYGNRTFYEIWEVIKTEYTVTFSSAGGVYAPSMKYVFDPDHPDETISLESYIATWDNHKFKGWFKEDTFIHGPVTSFPTSTKADFILYAKWVEMASYTAYDLVYNGTEQTGVSVYGCTVTAGTNKETDKGDYSATLTLTSGFEWRDTDDTSATKTADWQITARPLIVISDSIWGTYTGEGYSLSIPAAAYTAFGLVGTDASKISITVSGTLSEPGILATEISVTNKTGEDILANYAPQTITGTVIVTESAVSTVTVSNEVHTMGMMASPAVQAAVSPSGSRRWML